MSCDSSIEQFAAVLAQLDDSFADRAHVLTGAGLDEASWSHLEAHWRTLLAADSGGGLARRFGEAYAVGGRAVCSDPRPQGNVASAPCFVGGDAELRQRERASVALNRSVAVGFAQETRIVEDVRASRLGGAQADPEQTVELASWVPRPVLPFKPALALEDTGIRAVVRSTPAPRNRPGGDPMAGTLEMPLSALSEAALPFNPLPPRYRRLHSFDPRTGEPLPTPYWVDEPADPTEPR